MLLITATKKKKSQRKLYSLSPFLRSSSFPGNSCWRKFINEFVYRMSRMGSHMLSPGWVPSVFPFLLGGCSHKQVKCLCEACDRRANIFTSPIRLPASQAWGGQGGPADEDENHSHIRERSELERVPLAGHRPLWCMCPRAGTASPELREGQGSRGVESERSYHTRPVLPRRAGGCCRHGRFCSLTTWNEAQQYVCWILVTAREKIKK